MLEAIKRGEARMRVKDNQRMYEVLTKGGIAIPVRIIPRRTLKLQVFDQVKIERDAMRVEMQERFKDYYPCVRALMDLEKKLQKLCEHILVKGLGYEFCERCDMKLYEEPQEDDC